MDWTFIDQTDTQQIKGKRMPTILSSLIPQVVARILIFTQYFYCSREFQNRISAMIMILTIYERGSKFQIFKYGVLDMNNKLNSTWESRVWSHTIDDFNFPLLLLLASDGSSI